MTTDTGTAVDHYDRLLAEHYTWMLGGDVHEVADRQATLLSELGLAGVEDGGTAIDLGCGSGAQTLALVRLGFSPVIAMDTSSRLLDELVAHAQGTGAVRPVHGDIRTVLPETAEPGTVAAVVCMGDTLPHLTSKTDVPVLLGHIGRALASGGHLVVTYRDLTAELRGSDRFIPVRSSDDRLLTCFLEYRDEDTVVVHDLLHTRTNGSSAGCLPGEHQVPRCRPDVRWRKRSSGPGSGTDSVNPARGRHGPWSVRAGRLCWSARGGRECSA